MIKAIFEELKNIDKTNNIFSDKQLNDIADVLVSNDSDAKKKEALISIIEVSIDENN